MSAEDLDAPPAEGSPSKIKQLLPVVLAAVLGLGAGSASGMFVVGPVVAKQVVHAAAAPAKPVGEGKDKDGKDLPKLVYPLDNLVLNPAESGGSRFLLLSVAFETTDAALIEEMKTRDAELRDLVLVTLGTKTVEQLADMHARDAMKTELAAAAMRLFKKKGAPRVYFPQFVIQ